MLWLKTIFTFKMVWSHSVVIFVVPKSGMSKEELEWLSSQHKMLGPRTPQLLQELKTHSERMRRHFMDDPDALAKWVMYENDVHAAFGSFLKNPVAPCTHLPNSVLYKNLMRERSSKSLVSMFLGILNNKRIIGAASTAAVGIAVGIAVWPHLTEPVEAAEGIGCLDCTD